MVVERQRQQGGNSAMEVDEQDEREAKKSKNHGGAKSSEQAKSTVGEGDSRGQGTQDHPTEGDSSTISPAPIRMSLRSRNIDASDTSRKSLGRAIGQGRPRAATTTSQLAGQKRVRSAVSSRSVSGGNSVSELSEGSHKMEGGSKNRNGGLAQKKRGGRDSGQMTQEGKEPPTIVLDDGEESDEVEILTRKPDEDRFGDPRGKQKGNQDTLSTTKRDLGTTPTKRRRPSTGDPREFLRSSSGPLSRTLSQEGRRATRNKGGKRSGQGVSSLSTPRRQSFPTSQTDQTIRNKLDTSTGSPLRNYRDHSPSSPYLSSTEEDDTIHLPLPLSPAIDPRTPKPQKRSRLRERRVVSGPVSRNQSSPTRASQTSTTSLVTTSSAMSVSRQVPIDSLSVAISSSQESGNTVNISSHVGGDEPEVSGGAIRRTGQREAARRGMENMRKMEIEMGESSETEEPKRLSQKRRESLRRNESSKMKGKGKEKYKERRERKNVRLSGKGKENDTREALKSKEAAGTDRSEESESGAKSHLQNLGRFDNLGEDCDDSMSDLPPVSELPIFKEPSSQASTSKAKLSLGLPRPPSRSGLKWNGSHGSSNSNITMESLTDSMANSSIFGDMDRSSSDEEEEDDAFTQEERELLLDKPDATLLLGSQVVCARLRRSMEVYWPATVVEFRPGDIVPLHQKKTKKGKQKRLKKSQYLVKFFDGMERWLERDMFIALGERGFNTCKLGEWEVLGGKSIEDLTQETCALLPIFERTIKGKYLPSLSSHEDFLAGGKRRNRLAKRSVGWKRFSEPQLDAIGQVIVEWLMGESPNAVRPEGSQKFEALPDLLRSQYISDVLLPSALVLLSMNEFEHGEEAQKNLQNPNQDEEIKNENQELSELLSRPDISPEDRLELEAFQLTWTKLTKETDVCETVLASRQFEQRTRAAEDEGISIFEGGEYS